MYGAAHLTKFKFNSRGSNIETIPEFAAGYKNLMKFDMLCELGAATKTRIVIFDSQ